MKRALSSATVPATTGKEKAPTIAFLAHVETLAPILRQWRQTNCHHAWDGADIVLPDDPSKVLSIETSPYLANKIGDDIITAGGLTLLGADDKSGCAIVVTLAERLLTHPKFPTAEFRLCFTTDEEIGTGVQYLI